MGDAGQHLGGQECFFQVKATHACNHMNVGI
jgi:hypothetical protein